MGFHLQSENPQSPWDLQGDFKYLVPLILTRRECLQEIILNKDGEGKNHNLDTHGRGNKGRATLRGQLSDEEKLDFLMSLIELYVMTTSATMTFLYISHADHCDPSSINFLRRMVNKTLKNIDFLLKNKEQINDSELAYLFDLTVKYPFSSFCH